MNVYVCPKCKREVTVRSQAKVLTMACVPAKEDGKYVSTPCSESPVEFELKEAKTSIVVATKLPESIVNKAPLPPSTISAPVK